MHAKPMTTIATIITTASAASRYGVWVVDTPFTRFTVKGTEPTTTRSPTTTPSHQRWVEMGASPKTATRPAMCNVVCVIDRLHSGSIDVIPDAHGNVVDEDVADGSRVNRVRDPRGPRLRITNPRTRSAGGPLARSTGS